MFHLGFIGMGNMASAIVKGIKQDCVINAFDIDKTKCNVVEGVCGLDSIEDVIESSDIIFLAVKPNIVEGIIKKNRELLKNKAVVSIVAGYLYQQLEPLFLKTTRHLSIMPNTPLQVRQGMTLFEKVHSLNNKEFDFVTRLFNDMGKTQVLETYQMAAGTAISGCGPAFVYKFIEAMADGGVMLGLPRDVAYSLASQTIVGSGTMQLETKLHPAILKDNVCSPGGLTIKGVAMLEEHAFSSAVIEAIKSTT